MHFPYDPVLWLKDLFIGAGLSFKMPTILSTIGINVQSEIFEHLLAMINEFGLKVFQQPTGDDLLTLSKTN
jgi:hypothetical protein